MNYIRITKDNIDKEHICCAMSGKQSIMKKEWMKQRFDEGLVFYRSEERGKCFIEYIPAENAWVPIEADGYIYIDCLWIAGSMKGHGYSNDLLNECIEAISNLTLLFFVTTLPIIFSSIIVFVLIRIPYQLYRLLSIILNCNI